jgi:hypothetical protein
MPDPNFGVKTIGKMLKSEPEGLKPEVLEVFRSVKPLTVHFLQQFLNLEHADQRFDFENSELRTWTSTKSGNTLSGMVVKGESKNIQNGIIRSTHINGSWVSERTSFKGKCVGINRSITAESIGLYFNYKDKEKPAA